MTNYERTEFKKWNIDITENEDKQCEVGYAIEEKYFRLNGSRSCNPETFIYEIATAEGVSREEKIQDIGKYVKCMEAMAKVDALLAILHIYR